jgi:hypothetical protein
MSQDFWWGVAAATAGWVAMSGATVLAFSWIIARDERDERAR